MKLYFRPGAACVIYNETGKILIFERKNLENTWQFPQGGIDLGESIEQTLWRELEEETGIVRDEILEVTEYPEWTIYEYPDDVKATIGDPYILGQAHRWYFLKIANHAVIDLSKAADHEFKNWRWSTFPELLMITVAMKYPVYEKLATFFLEQIKPKLK